MKILIKNPNARSIRLHLPTKLVFHPGFLRWGMRIANKNTGNDIPNIPPDAIYALCKCICTIKDQYKTWELVNIESAKGEIVQMIL